MSNACREGNGAPPAAAVVAVAAGAGGHDERSVLLSVGSSRVEFKDPAVDSKDAGRPRLAGVQPYTLNLKC